MPVLFNGMGMHLGIISRLSNARTRSISAENPTGEKGGGGMAEPDPGGPARELGRGWKCRPCVSIKPGEIYVLADIEGSGAIQSMWFAGYAGRDFILRIYWDDQEHPSVECPLPDFFAMPWVSNDMSGLRGPLSCINSLPVSVNPNRGLNCFWEMPFKKRCKIMIANLHPRDGKTCYYHILDDEAVAAFSQRTKLYFAERIRKIVGKDTLLHFNSILSRKDGFCA